MGFSLQAFFEELFFILGDNVMQDNEKVAQLKKMVEHEHTYAMECGHLPADGGGKHG